MSEILDFYQEQAKAELSTVPWLAELKAQALQDFKRRGFPTRQNEEWKYTVMDAFLQQRFSQQRLSVSAKIDQITPFTSQISLINGQIMSSEFIRQLPSQVIIKPLLQSLSDHTDKIQPYLDKLLKREHGFHALNTAALNTGVFIYLPKGVSIPEPIVLAHWQDQALQASHSRHLIVAEEGSQATIIETFHGQDDACYFTNTVSEIYLAKQANITHYKIQCESKAAFHIGHLAVNQAQESQFASHSLSLGGKLVRSDVTIDLQETQAQCLMNGIYLPGDKQHIDHHTVVNHRVADCKSVQDYKGILMDKARAVFNGKVVVAKHAQHTQASQQNKNLLLSANAEIDTKPQLEIFADDVVCSHGATVGQLDADALFYMAARGIDKQEAKKYLIHAFAADNLSLIPNTQMEAWMLNLINQQLR